MVTITKRKPLQSFNIARLLPDLIRIAQGTSAPTLSAADITAADSINLGEVFAIRWQSVAAKHFSAGRV